MTKPIVLAVVALALVACGGSDDGKPAGTRIASTGKIEIVEPKHGATVEGPTVTVRVRVTGARILEQQTATREIKPDVGHVHISLDDRTISFLAGERYVIEDVSPGEHLIEAEFAAGDHDPFSPRVTAVATITVT